MDVVCQAPLRAGMTVALSCSLEASKHYNQSRVATWQVEAVMTTAGRVGAPELTVPASPAHTGPSWGGHWAQATRQRRWTCP